MTLIPPHDADLEVDVLATIACDGDRRWLLGELVAEDFWAHRTLFRGLEAMHRAGIGGPRWVIEGHRVARRWSNTDFYVDDWVNDRLDAICDEARVVANPTGALVALRALRRQRDGLYALEEAAEQISVGVAAGEVLDELRRRLEAAQ